MCFLKPYIQFGLYAVKLLLALREGKKGILQFILVCLKVELQSLRLCLQLHKVALKLQMPKLYWLCAIWYASYLCLARLVKISSHLCMHFGLMSHM